MVCCYIDIPQIREHFVKFFWGKYRRAGGTIFTDRYCKRFSANTLLRRVEFGIWLKHHTPREISNLSVVFESQIPLSAEACLRLTPQHLFIDPFCSVNGDHN